MSGKYTPSTSEKERQRRQISARGEAVLECIRASLKAFGVPATRAEIARALNVNQTTVDHHLTRLALAGYLEFRPKMQRGIRLLREGTPLLKKSELVDFDELDEHRRIDTIEDLFGTVPTWFVRIDNEEFAHAGLNTGDIVAISKDREPSNEDNVWTRVGDKIELMRSQDEAHGEIVGVIIGVVKGTSQGSVSP